MNRLIINADDYGLGKLFNQRIIELAQRNILTSISVMINRTAVFPKELLNLKNISIGLQLELDNKSEISKAEKQIKKFRSVFSKLPSHLDGH